MSAFLHGVVRLDGRRNGLVVARLALVLAVAAAAATGFTTRADASCTNPPVDDADCDGLLDGADPCPADTLNRCYGDAATCQSGSADCTPGTDLRLNFFTNTGGDLVDCNGLTWIREIDTLDFTNSGVPSQTPIENVFGTGCGADADTQEIVRRVRSNDTMTRSYGVPNGTYLVNLLFAEVNVGTCVAASRTIDVDLEGVRVLGGGAAGDGFDTYATSAALNGVADACGGLVVRSFLATVADGALDLVLTEDDQGIGDDRAAISAIEILAPSGCVIDADCDDGIDCTDDACVDELCENAANDASCDDGEFCNGNEVCSVTSDCQAGTPVDCDDGVGCTDDSCDEGADACVNVTNDSNCDDGDFCNGTETCDLVSDCQAGTPVDCDDGIGCTDDSCNEATDACDNVANDANCDDGAFCNGDETCDAGSDCQPGTAPCDDGVECTDDSCDEGSDSCGNVANDANCDDGLFCNGDETCDANDDCQAGAGLACDDGVACTVDGCDEGSQACSFTPSDAICDDGTFCNGAETCDVALGCQAGTPIDCSELDSFCGTAACNETIDDCEITPENEGEVCDDGDACSTGDLCTEGLCVGDSDCGTPVSNGAFPVATDALFTLKVSVGSEVCELCTCDVNGDGRVSVLDALAILKRAVGQAVELICAPASSTTTMVSGSTTTMLATSTTTIP